MKKSLTLISIILVVGLIATSCKKEKTCECKTYTDGELIATTEITIQDGKCSDGNSTTTVMGITTKMVCD